ncbi:MAG: FmdE family protein [Desulfovibrionaceae bacterium]
MTTPAVALFETHDDAIGPYSFEAFVEAAGHFHGYAAPGLLLGGFMVDAARKCLPEGILYDAVSETAWCLPDAVQMLTPCTVGNGWLRILNLGLYAVTLYDKCCGKGFRVALDMDKLDPYPDIRVWLLKSMAKKEQDSGALREQIRLAGASICTISPVTVDQYRLRRKAKGAIATCPLCGAAFPAKHGRICRLCQGEGPYLGTGRTLPDVVDEVQPELTRIPVDKAVGRRALHDMTRIVPEKSKGVAFHKGHEIGAGDVCRLQQLGRFHVYVADERSPDPDWVHEDTAAETFATAMAGPGVASAGAPREGKVTLVAAHDGLLTVDRDGLEAFNLLPDVMCASRQDGLVMDKGARVAATRAIPLFIGRERFESAMRLIGDKPLFSVLPMRAAKVGILVTGTEIAQGIIQDKFAPIISGKVMRFGCTVVDTVIAPDDRKAIADGVARLLDAGADLLVTTAGLSVDPDDVTRKGLADAGATDMLYGAPILPGAMTLLARIGTVQVVGVPACALFFKTTSFDLLLPRLLAGQAITRKDLSRMAVGSMCMECKTCTFPRCPFGK